MAVPTGGKVSKGVNPFSGNTVAHSAKAWAAIRSAWTKAPYNQPEYNPMAPLAGKSLYNAVNNITSANLKAANQPHEQNITQLGGQQQGVSQRLAAYDQLVGGKLQDTANNAKQLEGEDQNRIAQNAQAAADRLNQTGTGINNELTADAANRGPGLGGGARDQIQQELAAQKQYGSSTAGTNSLLAGQLGNSLSGLTNTMVGTAAMRGRESQGDVANRYAQAIGKEKAAEQSNIDKLPADRSNLLLSLRDKEFTRQATAEKLQLTGQKQAADAANNAAKLRLATSTLGETTRHNKSLESLAHGNTSLGWARLDETTRHNHQSEINSANSIIARGRGKSGGGLSQTQNNQITNAINLAWGFDPSKPGIGTALTTGSRVKGTKTTAGYQFPKINPTYVTAATELRRYGTISLNTYRALQGLGYKVPAAWYTSAPGKAPLNRGATAA